MSQKIARLAGSVMAFIVLVLGAMAISSGSAFAGSHVNVQSLRYEPCFSDYCSSVTYTYPGGSYSRSESGNEDEDEDDYY